MSVSVSLKPFGTSPLPHPTSHENILLGGRVGERAGAALFTKPKNRQ